MSLEQVSIERPWAWMFEEESKDRAQSKRRAMEKVPMSKSEVEISRSSWEAVQRLSSYRMEKGIESS